MRWFRFNRQWGGSLALLALALQLVLSFDHIHAKDLGLAAPGAGNASLTQTPTNSGTPPSSKDSDDADDLCAICLLIQLAGSSVHPVAPVLDLPQQFDWVRTETSEALLLPTSLYLPFNARAPPVAWHQG
jgi:hypothetical protein